MYRIILVIASLASMLLFSCANDMEVVNKIIDPEEEPDVIRYNVEMLYSDSARLQMKMTAPLMKIYESAKEAREECPKGLHVRFYEKTGEFKAELTANWAKHDVTKDLYEAQGNVIVTNAEGRKLETEQLFYNPKKGIVYSEKYTKITEPNGNMATGKSFSSNQDFSNPKLIKGNAILYIKDEEENKPE